MRRHKSSVQVQQGLWVKVVEVSRLFEDCESSMVDIKLLFFQTLYAWVNSVGVSSINSITELIDHCCF
jgi:hypothetical protein